MPRPRASLQKALGLCLWFVAGAVTLDEAPAYADGPSTPEAAKAGGRMTWEGMIRKSRGTRPEGLDTSWWGMAGITLALAVSGGIYAACRRLVPRNGSGDVQVVSRVSLSPKHSVYTLRVGRRVLLVGAGPQGAPSLIAELDELPGSGPNVGQGGEP
jgi:hypothetical protein